jgi:hypothetical protein
MSARADLCGGRSEMIVPTATSLSTDNFRYADLSALNRAWISNSHHQSFTVGPVMQNLKRFAGG